MAKIIENTRGRRSIRLSVDDVINVVREYQNLTRGVYTYQTLRKKLEDISFWLPED